MIPPTPSTPGVVEVPEQYHIPAPRTLSLSNALREVDGIKPRVALRQIRDEIESQEWPSDAYIAKASSYEQGAFYYELLPLGVRLLITRLDTLPRRGRTPPQARPVLQSFIERAEAANADRSARPEPLSYGLLSRIRWQIAKADRFRFRDVEWHVEHEFQVSNTGKSRETRNVFVGSDGSEFASGPPIRMNRRNNPDRNFGLPE